MPFETEAGAMFKGKLLHFRAPGKLYHLRVSVHPAIGKLRHDWIFDVVENSILFTHKKTNLVFAYAIMPNPIHLVLQPIPRVRQGSAWCDYRQILQIRRHYSQAQDLHGARDKSTAWAVWFSLENASLGAVAFHSPVFNRTLLTGESGQVSQPEDACSKMRLSCRLLKQQPRHIQSRKIYQAFFVQ